MEKAHRINIDTAGCRWSGGADCKRQLQGFRGAEQTSSCAACVGVPGRVDAAVYPHGHRGPSRVLLLWAAIAGTALLFRFISKPAGWLMLPYLAWVTFAGYLNLGVYILNR